MEGEIAVGAAEASYKVVLVGADCLLSSVSVMAVRGD
jgi:hypothetical protein